MDEGPVDMIVDNDPFIDDDDPFIDDDLFIDDNPIITPVRTRQVPRVVSDHLPIAPLGVLSSPEDSATLLGQPELTQMRFTAPAANNAKHIQTLPNKFGISRYYFDMPTSIPDEDVTLPELINPILPPSADSEDQQGSSKTTQKSVDESVSIKDQILNIIHPHPNFSAYLMSVWFYRRGSMQKSKHDRSILVKDVMLNPAFDAMELEPPFSFNALDDALVDMAGGITSPEQLGAGWIKCDVVMDIPAMGCHLRTTWPVPGAYYRDIVQVAQQVIESRASIKFNYDGFEEWWQPPSSPLPKQRVYHNVYSADSFLQAEAQLRCSIPKDYNGPPCRIAGLMFWSDSTHLTNFGQACLHPIYMAFVNESKADRCHPNKRCLHHIAYMPEVRIRSLGFTLVDKFVPQLPSELITFLTNRLGKVPSSTLLAHLKQELFQAVWRLLLNDAFVKAHKEGVDMMCGDGIQRLLFLRVFTYSADCPER